MKIVLATANRDKIHELKHALEGLPLSILTRDDFPGLPEVIEDGSTLDENARKKALALCKATGLPAIADDTGLEVDALDGEPGVRSSRFAGEDVTYSENVAELLRRMEGVPEAERTARFRCVLALVEPSGAETFVEGACDGTILTAPRGDGGFGYDPVFLVPSMKKTFAELTTEEKNRISHRGLAVQRMRKVLEDRLLHS